MLLLFLVNNGHLIILNANVSSRESRQRGREMGWHGECI
jgi:hypothetical protein